MCQVKLEIASVLVHSEMEFLVLSDKDKYLRFWAA